MTLTSAPKAALMLYMFQVDPAGQTPFPALVRHTERRVPDGLTPLDAAAPGDIVAIVDIVAMVSGYAANFEEGGLERCLESFHVIGDEGLRFKRYEDFADDGERGFAARWRTCSLAMTSMKPSPAATWSKTRWPTRLSS